MNIVPLSIPTPFYVGDVNVYLVREDPLTLIDVGPKTEEAYSALVAGLRRNGVALKEIKRIVLTHAHEDHCGLARRVRDEAGNAEIFVHDWETGHLFGRLEGDHHEVMMKRAGVPPEVFEKMRATYEDVSLLTDSLAQTEYSKLVDEMELEFDGGALEVLHTPGHTPGSCSFLRRADRTILCGDCVLKRITPNPIVSPDPVDPRRRFNSLAEYLVSLARIRAEAPTLVYGGHGEPITDFEEIFNRYRRAIDERQKKMISSVNGSGVTVWDVAQMVFPDAIEKELHQFLAISEASAHLDYAETTGRIRREVDSDTEYYVI